MKKELLVVFLFVPIILAFLSNVFVAAAAPCARKICGGE